MRRLKAAVSHSKFHLVLPVILVLLMPDVGSHHVLVEPDREDPPDPGMPGPGDQVLRRVVAEAEVSVRIDHAGQCRSDYRSRRANAATARAITTPV